MKNNKIIYLAGAIVLVTIVFFVGIFYFGWFSRRADIQKINDETAIYPYYVKDNNGLYYLNNKDYFWYKYDLNTKQKTKLSEKNLLGVTKIDYKPDGKNAVVYSNYPEFNIVHYDLESNKTYDLNQFITSIIWDSKKSELFYTFYKFPGPNDELDEYKLNFNQSDYSGKDWQEIKDFSKSNYIDLNLYPSNDETYIYYVPAPIDQGGTLKKLLINTKQDEIMTKENIIFSNIVFSPDTSKFAFINGDKQLAIQNTDDKDSVKVIYKDQIKINQAVWANNNEDLYILKDFDNLVKINIKNGKQTTIKPKGEGRIDGLDYTIKNLGLSQDDKVLYFSYNNYFYKIEFK